MAALLLLSLVPLSFPYGGDSSPATGETDHSISDTFHSVGGYFTENMGQVTNDQVRFYSSGGMQVGFADSAVLLKLTERSDVDRVSPFEEGMRGPRVMRDDVPPGRGVMVRMTFPGSNKVTPQGVQEMPHRSNYFIGNDPSKWRTGVRSYREVMYHNLYEGIDLVYRVGPDGLKYDFVVQAGVDPSRIRLTYEGIETLDVNPESIVLHTAAGKVRDEGMVAMAGDDPVSCRFTLVGIRSAGFVCEGWDSVHPLVIDPLLWATFLGGSYGEDACDIALDGSNDVVVVGYTDSADFPVTPGAYDLTHNGNSDAFVAKLSPDGSSLIWATFLGGEHSDGACGIVLDASGSLVVVGDTNSADFPATSGAYDVTFNGHLDVFVAKLSPDGSSLFWATYLGGGEYEISHPLALDAFGNPVVAGETDSADFPATPGAYDVKFNGVEDAFVAKLSADGSSLIWATYLGGDNFDKAPALSIDSSGNPVVAGTTFSVDLPVTIGAYDVTFNGGPYDAYAAKLSSDGSSLIWATYLGGGGEDDAQALALDASDGPVVTGYTESSDFPVTLGAYDVTHNGFEDAFVAKLSANGSSLIWATFLGGDYHDDACCDLALDVSGNPVVIGATSSVDFPTTPGAYDVTYNGQYDTFVAKLSADASSLIWATYLGGSDWDAPVAVAIDSSNNAVVSGVTDSADFPVTPGSFDANSSGAPFDREGFVAKLSLITNLPPVAEAGPDKSAKVGETITFDGSLSYDPDFSGSWTKMAPMPTARRGAGVAAVGHRIYVIGGLNDDPLSTNEVYDVDNNTWYTAAPMPTPRDIASAIALGDRIYVIGGRDIAGVVDTNEEYNVTNGTWTSRAPIPGPEVFYGLGVAYGKIYGFGGYILCEYSPASDSWRIINLGEWLPGGLSATSLHNIIYGFGGEQFGGPTLAYRYDPQSDTFSKFQGVSIGRSEAASVALAERLFVLGGEDVWANANVTGANEMYDPVAGSWTNKTFMPTARDELGAVAVGDALYAIGGASKDWISYYDCNERYSVALAFDWDFGDGTAHSHQRIATHSYNAPGIFTVTLKVTDAEGAIGTDNSTVTITKSNQPPVAEAGGPYNGYEGSSIILDGSISVDPDNDTLQFRWDFEGDGTWDTNWSLIPFASHTWGDDWSGTAVLEVSDGELTDNDTAVVTVENVLPSGTIQITNFRQLEGAPVLFDAHITDPGSDDIFLRWHWGFGAPDDNSTNYNNGVSTDPYPSTDIHPRDVYDSKDHTYGDNGAFTVTVYISDDDSGTQATTLTLTATPDNLPPTVNVDGGMTIDEGDSVMLSATATDPGSDDLEFAWSWGDGSSESRTYYNDGTGPDAPQSPNGMWPFTATDAAAHEYGDNGLYTVSLKVTDDDGGYATWSGQLTVKNLPPEIAPFGPFSVGEGSPLSAAANATDPGSDDLTFEWTFELGPTLQTTYYNEGTGPDPPLSPGGTYPFTATDTVAHTYGDNAVYTLRLTVTDDDGGSASYTTYITVLNLPPSIEPFGPFTVDEGIALDVAANASDEGSDDLTFLWEFELGRAGQNVHYNEGANPDPARSPWGTFPFAAVDSATNAYGDNAVYSLVLIVTDDDGGSATYETSITVDNLPPVIKPFGPFELNEAEPLSVTANATDPGSDDLMFDWTFEYGPATQSVHFNDGVGPDPQKSPWGTFPFSSEDMAAHTYGDDGVFAITLTVTDDDGGVTTYSTTVVMHNVPPTIVDSKVFLLANITLRVAGEKWHDVVLRLYEDGQEAGWAQVIRYPGSPNDQTVTVHDVEIALDRNFSAVAYYTPDDDPINGQLNGANPAWLIINWENGGETVLNHTFNVQHNDTWVWTVYDFNIYAVNQIIHFTATATDPGSDDLTFTWDWGDGTPAIATTYFNDGIGPDPYPSPDGIYPFSATDSAQHIYSMAGNYSLTLTVMDDDGGMVNIVIVLVIP